MPQPDDKDPKYTPQSIDEMVEDNFDMEYENDLQVDCGLVYVLPAEYDRVSVVYEVEEDYVQDEVVNQDHICYYVMNNNVVEEQQAIFERPDLIMMYHLIHYSSGRR